MSELRVARSPASGQSAQRLEHAARVVRALAVAWSTLMAATFFVLWCFPTLGTPLAYPVDPAFAGITSIVTVGFLVAMSWPSHGDTRRLVVRTLTLLQWQVAVGAALVLNLMLAVQGAASLSYGVAGLYALVAGLTFMPLKLVQLALIPRYEQTDRDALLLQIREQISCERCTKRRHGGLRALLFPRAKRR